MRCTVLALLCGLTLSSGLTLADSGMLEHVFKCSQPNAASGSAKAACDRELVALLKRMDEDAVEDRLKEYKAARAEIMYHHDGNPVPNSARSLGVVTGVGCAPAQSTRDTLPPEIRARLGDHAATAQVDMWLAAARAGATDIGRFKEGVTVTKPDVGEQSSGGFIYGKDNSVKCAYLYTVTAPIFRQDR